MGEEEVQTSDLCFIKCGPQWTMLRLGVTNNALFLNPFFFYWLPLRQSHII